jgi:hypothetical protein
MIEFISKVIPDAYHGTSRANAETIVRTRRFLPSTGGNCFLGDGIYFFESGKEHAKWWARRQYRWAQIGIIVANIQLGKCLELGNKAHVELVKMVKQKLEQKGYVEGVTDAFTINFLTKEIDTEIETVRGYFPGSREKLFAGSRIFKFLHVVICVKKHDNILDFRMV